MDKLIELLQQIQDLAGVAIDALKGAGGEGEGGGGGGAPGGGGPPPGQPREGARPPGGGPPEGSPAEERGESPEQERREGGA
jgi:hypothetical protein